MEKLQTPFGNINIIIDGTSVPYEPQKEMPIEFLCPDVLDRYQIGVFFAPDGKPHEISCTFSPTCSYKKSKDPGENLECQSFYNSQGYKMSIGIECKIGYFSEKCRTTYRYDYNGEYLENGMSFLILDKTKTNHFVFGIAWIDNVYADDQTNEALHRKSETWYGADPCLLL